MRYLKSNLNSCYLSLVLYLVNIGIITLEEVISHENNIICFICLIFVIYFQFMCLFFMSTIYITSAKRTEKNRNRIKCDYSIWRLPQRQEQSQYYRLTSYGNSIHNLSCGIRLPWAHRPSHSIAVIRQTISKLNIGNTLLDLFLSINNGPMLFPQ